MFGRRIARGLAAATLPLAIAVQSVLAIGSVPLDGATPAPGEASRQSIDPGFAITVDGLPDPGFVAVFEDRSNDTGFIVGRDTLAPAPSPTPPPTIPATPAITLGAP